MMYWRGPSEKEVPPMTKLTAGRLSTASHPASSRHVLVSGENIIPGISCRHTEVSDSAPRLLWQSLHMCL